MNAAVSTNGEQRFEIVRIGNGPIIEPATHPSIGTNIQGPSLVAAPPWLAEPLGRYYLYFADHKGSHIRLATADFLDGPWTVHEGGALDLESSCFLTEPPEATTEQLAHLRARYEQALGATYAFEGLLADAVTPHIASPDVHVDVDNQQVVMYFHGLDSLGVQVTRAAVSTDGLGFVARPEVLGGPYMRMCRHDDWWYGLTMPGQLCRSRDGLTGFEHGPTLFPSTMRHSALWCHDGQLDVIWSRVGDAPESLLVSTIQLGPDWLEWTASEPSVLLSPEHDWEGADLPNVASLRGGLHAPANQLRDPAVFIEDDRIYVLYAVAGESGIALAELLS